MPGSQGDTRVMSFWSSSNIGFAIHVKRTRSMKEPDIRFTVNSSEMLWLYSIPAL